MSMRGCSSAFKNHNLKLWHTAAPSIYVRQWDGFSFVPLQLKEPLVLFRNWKGFSFQFRVLTSRDMAKLLKATSTRANKPTKEQRNYLYMIPSSFSEGKLSLPQIVLDLRFSR